MEDFMKYNRDDITTRFNSGEKLDYVFFWKPGQQNQIHKGCLGQWWGCKFTIDGVTYNCAEQYMMAEKARAFPGNEDLIKDFIMPETNPAQHKKYGRMVKNYDDKVWDRIRKDVVVKGNMAKFSQNPELKRFLLNTGNAILVEASPLDKIWGIKMAETDPGVDNPNNWMGTNHLGFALMEVRDELRR